MPVQQFENDDSLRAQRMTAEEAKAVIDLWQTERFEQTSLTDRPAVPDVAEGLDLGVADVQRLLAEVRARRLEEERALAQEQELSEVRLAEEERQLAEIRRQRAELRREQSEAERQSAMGQAGISPARVSLYTKQTSNRSGSFAGLIIVIFILTMLAAFGTLSSISHSPQPQTVMRVIYSFDDRGKVNIDEITCSSAFGVSEPCDDDTLEKENASLQQSHDQELAARKLADAKKSVEAQKKAVHAGTHDR